MRGDFDAHARMNRTAKAKRAREKGERQRDRETEEVVRSGISIDRSGVFCGVCGAVRSGAHGVFRDESEKQATDN